MLEEISRGIAKIVQMKEKGQYVQAIEQVNRICKTYFEDLTIESEQNEQKLYVYALLLKEEGDILLQKGENSTSKEKFQEAYNALAKADQISKNFNWSIVNLQSQLRNLLNR